MNITDTLTDDAPIWRGMLTEYVEPERHGIFPADPDDQEMADLISEEIGKITPGEEEHATDEWAEALADIVTDKTAPSDETPTDGVDLAAEESDEDEDDSEETASEDDGDLEEPHDIGERREGEEGQHGEE